MNNPITSISDLLDLARYDLLFASGSPEDTFLRLFAHPVEPIVSVLLYWFFSGPLFSFLRRTFNIQPKGPGLQTLTVAHSAALAVYSMWTFYNSVRIALPIIARNGFYSSLCDVDGKFWHSIGFWVSHFYVSKYYEFLDTWIVLLKGREPMFLQTYHHAGIVLLMWLIVVSKCSSAGVIILILNSFIHSLMYSYYVLAALGYNSPLKHYLTQAQIVQFLVGVTITIPTYACITSAQAVSLAGIHIYTVILIYLFYQFYVASYSSKSKKGTKKE